MLLPAWLARIVHVPAARIVTLLPETAHTLVVSDAKLTGRPDDAVALTLKAGLPKVLLPSTPKLMV